MVENITVAAEASKPLTVNLVGVEYTVKPPKRAFALTIMAKIKTTTDDPADMQETVDAIVLRMFGKKVAPTVRKRLNDPEDDLDVDHIMILMNKVIERAAGGDPTT